MYVPNQYHIMELPNEIARGKYTLVYEFAYQLKTSLAGFYQFNYRLKSGETRSVYFAIYYHNLSVKKWSVLKIVGLIFSRSKI